MNEHEVQQSAEYVAVLRDLQDAYADHLDRWCAGQGAGTRHLPIIKADELLRHIDGSRFTACNCIPNGPAHAPTCPTSSTVIVMPDAETRSPVCDCGAPATVPVIVHWRTGDRTYHYCQSCAEDVVETGMGEYRRYGEGTSDAYDAN